jgi:peptidoglycan L-alanyl-D-glutamate endopeptidase CwlK
MPKFSKKSLEELNTCDTDLIKLMCEAIKIYDFTVTCGHRNEADQNKAFEENNSKFKWPLSKHNSYPSRAVDCAPYPIDYDDRERFKFFRGIVYGIASQLGIKLNKTIQWDLPHFELRG